MKHTDKKKAFGVFLTLGFAIIVGWLLIKKNKKTTVSANSSNNLLPTNSANVNEPVVTVIQSSIPSITSITANTIVYVAPTGSFLKLYKGGVYQNIMTVSGTTPWTGLSILSGDSYQISSTEIGKTESVLSTSKVYTVVAVNQVPLTVVNVAAQNNKLDFSEIPDITIPLLNGLPKLGVSFVGALRQGTGIDGANLFKKGFSSISLGSMTATEKSPTGLSSQQRFIWRNIDELGLNNLNHGNINLDNYSSYDNNVASHLMAMGNIFGFKNGKADIAGMYYDWENAPSAFREGENGTYPNWAQDHINRTYFLHKAMKNNLSTGARFALMYNNAPFLSPNKNSYNILPTNYLWTQPVAETPNSQAKGMDTAFVGQKLTDLGNDLLVFTETYFFAETIRNENVSVVMQDNSSYQCTHFGISDGNGLNGLKLKVGHWAAQLAINLHNNLKHIGGRKLLCELSTHNLNDKGYFFTVENWGGRTDRITASINGRAATSGFVEELPPYIVEGQVCMTLFNGAMCNLWDADLYSDSTVIRNDPRPTGNYGITAQHPFGDISKKFNYQFFGKAVDRIVNKPLQITASLNKSVVDLIDGSEIYLRENTLVDYQNGAGFVEQKGFIWEENKLCPVQMIINEPQGLCAIWATAAYEGSGEVRSFKVKYNANGFNFTSPLLTVRSEIVSGESMPVNEMWIFKM